MMFSKNMFLVVLFFATVGCKEFIVTKSQDTNDGACTPEDCSLREAIIAANATPGKDQITLPSGTYRLTLKGKYENAALTGDLDILESVDIVGAGAQQTVISGMEADRVFDLHKGRVLIEGMTITKGRVNTGGAGIKSRTGSSLQLRNVVVTDNYEDGPLQNGPGDFWDGGKGGGIFSEGDLDIEDSEITFNLNTNADETRSTGGAGIYHHGPKDRNTPTGEFARLRMNRVLVHGNRGWGNGGGLLMFKYSKGEISNCHFEINKTAKTPNAPGSLSSGGAISSYGVTNELVIRDTMIFNNWASGSGGGIENFGVLTIQRTTIDANNAHSAGSSGGGLWTLNFNTRIFESTISNNRATDMGGGILGGARFEMVNSTVSQNFARFGGGMTLFNDFPYLINFSTIANNRASSGAGGIAVRPSAALALQNTIFANNVLPSGTVNCAEGGPIASLDHNLADDETCHLHGPHDLIANAQLSPLADHGGPTLTHALLTGSPAIDAATVNCPPNDQTLYARPYGSKCDIGSYEWRLISEP